MTEAAATSVLIALDHLSPSPFNPRQAFDPKAMARLVENVKVHGVLEPLWVRPRPGAENGDYEIVAGWRRFTAAQQAGLGLVPCLVRELSDAKARELQLIENLQHEEMSAFDEAAGYKSLIDVAGYDVAKIAATVGKSSSHVYQRLKLLELVKPAQDALREGIITPAHAVQIARLEPKEQKEIFDTIVEKDYGTKDADRVATVRATADMIQREFRRELPKAIWPLDDAKLLPKAGPCTACPKNTANNAELYPDAKVVTCTDSACWRLKFEAFLERQRVAAKQASPGHAGHVDLTWNSYSSRRGKIKLNYEWREAKADSGHAHVGVVVEGEKEVGQIKYVCLDKTCELHWKDAARSKAYQADDRRARASNQARAAKEKLTKEIRRRVMEAVITQTKAPLSTEQLRLLAMRLWEEMWANYRSDIMAAQGWAASEIPHSHAIDYDKVTRKEIAPLAGDGLARLLMRLCLTRLVDVGGVLRGEDQLLSLAKTCGVDLRKIEAEAKVALAPKPKAALKVKPAPVKVKASAGKPIAKRAPAAKAKVHTNAKPAKGKK
jgi:ParB/RepB/Spo0J family partition protein